MSTVKVNELSTYSGTDISIETGKTVAGTASQFKMTGGSSGQYVQTDGAGALSFATVAETGFDDIAAFTTTQAYTIPTGITKQLFIVTGSGGGSGGSSGSAFASAGSAGGTVIKRLALAAGSVIQITIGAAGTGGATTANGIDGGDVTVASTSGTSFTTLTGPGGQKGIYNAGPTVSTVPTGGDINIPGGAGGCYYSSGGASIWGGGGAGGFGNTTAAADGIVPGSGGGGSMTGGVLTFVGGDGAPGIVMIHLYK
jgi:hypothetical protein